MLLNLAIGLLIFNLSIVNAIAGDWQSQIIKQYTNASIILQDSDGEDIFTHNPDKPMVPASILKIATADAVLSTLGSNYRIPTEVYLTQDHYIAIKGFGDPSLVSESLSSIAKQLKAHLKSHSIKQLKGFWLDTDFFQAQLKIHGQSHSRNPYDSSVGALVVNYNTIFVHKSGTGKITSAEPQTPLTATARQLAKSISTGRQRINLGQNKAISLKYFSELLQVFLNQEGIDVPLHIINKTIPETAIKLFVHQSPPLSEIVKNLFYFSNNLIANHLLLILGGIQKGAPADLNKGRQVLSDFLKQRIGIQNFHLQEGSGLSRKNQFSARQMITILKHFQSHQHLLKLDAAVFQAKTGTLRDVSSYAGYIISPLGKNYPFVIMLYNPRRTNDRMKVAQLLYQGVLEKLAY